MWGSLIPWCIMTLAIMAMWQYDIIKMRREREDWVKERKDLMDRIQAPSFAEYTSKVVREKKAEHPVEEEKPVEFVG